MKLPILYILHEGPDDKAFMEAFLKNDLKLKTNFRAIKYYAYSEGKTKMGIERFIENLDSPYFLLADADFDMKRQKKSALKKSLFEKYGIAENLIIIAINEIESWFLSGFDKMFCEKHQIKYYENTENVTKELFAKAYFNKNGKKSPKEFMDDLAKQPFSIEEAKKRNASFKHFYETIIEKT